MTELFIDGAWRPAADGAVREIYCPADGKLLKSVAEATPGDARDAVLAARRAFDVGPWPNTSSADRGALLVGVADRLKREKEHVARLEALDTGKRLVEARIDMDDVIAVFQHFAALAQAEAGRVIDTGLADVTSRVVHEPVGVCALITPWNFPLLQTSWKVAPALAAGNTFILKPSELTPSTAIWLLQALAEEGLPEGVANLVLGSGARL